MLHGFPIAVWLRDHLRDAVELGLGELLAHRLERRLLRRLEQRAHLLRTAFEQPLICDSVYPVLACSGSDQAGDTFMILFARKSAAEARCEGG